MMNEELTIEQVKKSFGGCEKCYGKGYATVRRGDDDEVNTCVCDRGKQIDKMLEGIRQHTLHIFISEMQSNLPEYIEEKYPKGKAKDRGTATVHITEFLLEVKKTLKIK